VLEKPVPFVILSGMTGSGKTRLILKTAVEQKDKICKACIF
jgi:Ni2+-binding GTPase involved in maturation of urease and hydrogenase